jgi:bifunctional non-homologous end joining protein LigD
VTWDEVDGGIAIEDFTIRNVPDRVRRIGDLWAPLLAKKGRFELEKYL